MRNHPIRNSLVALGLAAAFAAAPLAQAAAQDTTPRATTSNETIPDKAADGWITTKVKSEFATTSGVDATDISVDTHDGMVTLKGQVASSAEKMKAERVARSVKGVKSVDTSGLTITGSAGGQ
jgi:hyperosmotically inducible protein